MKTVRIAELKDNLSSYLREVEEGEVVEVTNRGRPVARIVPMPRDRLVIIPALQPFSEIRGKTYPPANWPVSSTELLLEDRRKR